MLKSSSNRKADRLAAIARMRAQAEAHIRVKASTRAEHACRDNRDALCDSMRDCRKKTRSTRTMNAEKAQAIIELQVQRYATWSQVPVCA